MSLRTGAVLGGLAVMLAASPADARVAGDVSAAEAAATRGKVRLVAMTRTPSSVRAGSAVGCAGAWRVFPGAGARRSGSRSACGRAHAGRAGACVSSEG